MLTATIPMYFVNGVLQGPLDGRGTGHLVLGQPARISLASATCRATAGDTHWIGPDGLPVHNTCLDVTPNQTGSLLLTWMEAADTCSPKASTPITFDVR